MNSLDEAVALIEQGQRDQGLALLEQIRSRSPRTCAALGEIAATYQRIGALALAEEIYQEALRAPRDKARFDVLICLGSLWVEAGRHQLGAKLFTDARKEAVDLHAEADTALRAAAELYCTEYHKWYYNTRVFDTTTFLGVKCQKSVSDMWNYQEILWALKPSLVVEFGTLYGGSALFFSSLLQAIHPHSRVLTVDVAHHLVAEATRTSPHIEMLTASSIDPRVNERIRQLREAYPGPVFAILDSAHRKTHVLDELLHMREVLRRGDYLIVEDGNINGHPVLPGWGEGPLEAVLEYQARHPGDYVRDLQRERKFGFTFAPQGFLIRQ